MNRAYSLLTIKAIGDTEDGKPRRFSGMATTPELDRVGDTIDPMGVKFTNPLVLLRGHDGDCPIGSVTFKKPTTKGIEFEAEIPFIKEAGLLKDRLDMAWGEIKNGLVKAVSIGFRPLKYAFRDSEEGFGIDFLETEVFELSTVSIPANAGALISAVKSIDGKIREKRGVKDDPLPTPPKTPNQVRAASGYKDLVVRLTPPASGTQPTIVKTTPKEGEDMKTIQEQLAALEAKRAATVAAMEILIQKSVDAGETMSAEDQTDYDAKEAEITAIDNQHKRLKSFEAIQAKSAKPAVQATAAAPSIQGLTPTPGVNIVLPPAPEKGIRFARYARCLALAHKGNADVLRVAENLYGQRDPAVVEMVKAAGAAVSAMTTGNTPALVGNDGGFADFVEFLRAMTIVGRFGTNGIPALRSIPFRVPLISQSTGGTAYWVGEGDGKPLTRTTLARTELAPLKVATIAVATMETLRDSSPSAERVIRDDIAAAVAERIDLSFIDPAVAGSANVSPASITNAAEAIAASGTDADAIRLDVRSAMQKFIDSKNPLNAGVWVMSSGTALSLSMMLNPLGQPEFPGITMQGGTFQGLPVLTSEYVGDYIVLMNASDVWLGDEGGINVDMSTEASLQMVDGTDEGATNNSATPVATSVVSMFQTNSAAFRAERTINWGLRRSTGVVVITDVAYGGPVNPS
jgi:HK97 family phage prohead protease